MGNKDIIEKAIQKAIDNGFVFNKEWYVDPSGRWVIFNIAKGYDSIKSVSYVYEQIIFNHEFAKALWGGELATCYDCMEGGHEVQHIKDEDRFGVADWHMYYWQWHLQQMVIAEDPIKYLGDNIK